MNRCRIDAGSMKKRAAGRFTLPTAPVFSGLQKSTCGQAHTMACHHHRKDPFATETIMQSTPFLAISLSIRNTRDKGKSR
jgi:hypothetical protein